MAVMNVSSITHFAHQHDVGILPHGMFHPHLKIDHVLTDLPLVDQAASSVYTNSIGSSSVRMCLL